MAVGTISREDLKAKLDRGDNVVLVESLSEEQYQHGGIFNESGTLTVADSTFSENTEISASTQGGGVNNRDGTATLRNTIVANSTSGGYNIDDGTTCGFSDDEEHNSLPRTDPLLANNGGPTKTKALLKGSPAINAIPEGESGCATEIKTDQRGVSRPQGSGCDIGAYEKTVRSR